MANCVGMSLIASNCLQLRRLVANCVYGMVDIAIINDTNAWTSNKWISTDFGDKKNHGFQPMCKYGLLAATSTLGKSKQDIASGLTTRNPE